MTVVTLSDFLPLPRIDHVAWSHVRIEEAPEALGPWTAIDTQALANPDPDPANPVPRTLTTTHATLPTGWYRVIWIDSDARESSPTAPIENVSALLAGVRPAIVEVAKLLRARTKVRGGSELGTFTTQTRPTGDEVEGLIDDSVDEVLGKVPVPAVGSDIERRTRGCVALYCAILVELSYWPEEVKSGQSPVAIYQALYKSRIDALAVEGETGETPGSGPANPAWDFPADAGALVGWRSRWAVDPADFDPFEARRRRCV